jgi:RNA polymerase sigma-70 factor (ECF subfamily)
MKPTDVIALPAVMLAAEPLSKTHCVDVVLEYYDQEYSSLRRYLVFLGVDGETAQEIVQESFLKLQEHLAKGGDQSHLRAWLYRVAHNLARNVQAAHRTRKTDRLEDVTILGDPVARELSVEENLIDRERTVRFREAMERLSDAQRSCLVLRAQGMKYREIADILKLSVSTVGENVQRGLGKLREML